MHRDSRKWRGPAAAPALAGLLAGVTLLALSAGIIAPAALAQTDAGGGNDDTPAPVTAGVDNPTAPPHPDAHPAPNTRVIVFTELGGTLAAPDLKLPDGATAVRQLMATLAKDDNVLLSVYKSRDGDIYADVLTAHAGQPWTPRNHIHLISPLPLRPEKMSVHLRYLDAYHRRGFLLICSDDAGDLAVAFPKGFGGGVRQQLFLASPPDQPDTRLSYNFADLDSRGFVIVKATVESAGQVKPSTDLQYFVWDGTRFIPRDAN